MKMGDNRKNLWSDEEIADLKKRWIAGESASVIGRIFGRTRSAVIGKIHRLGMSGDSRQQPSLRKIGGEKPRRQTPTRATPTTPNPQVEVKPAPRKMAIWEGSKTVAQGLRYNFECLFPISGSGADMVYCCKPTDNQNYCQEHKKRMYDPPAPRRPRVRAR